VGTKNYSINRKKDGTVIYEIDGALYGDLAHVPDESDRAVLAAMQDGSFEGEVEKEFGESVNAVDMAADTARMRTIFLCIFGGIAVLMLGVAAVSSFSVIDQVDREVTAPGSVVDTVVQQEYGDDSAFSYPVVAFTDRDGQDHTVKVSEGSSPPEWAVGDAVTVRYDPADPEGARIGSWTSDLLQWLLPGITGIVGIGFLLAVLLILKVMPPEIR
jgi:hypothetical protein